MSSIEDLNLNARITNSLTNAGITEIEVLAEMTDEQLDAIAGIAEGSITEIRAALDKWAQEATLEIELQPETIEELEADSSPLIVIETDGLSGNEKLAIARETLQWIYSVHASLDQSKNRPEPSGITIRLAQAIAQIEE